MRDEQKLRGERAERGRKRRRNLCRDFCVGEEFYSVSTGGIRGQVPNEMIRSAAVFAGIITETACFH